MEESLVIIKPDAFERGLCLEVFERLVSEYELIKFRLVVLSEKQVKEQYGYMRALPCFEEFVRFMISRPVYVMLFKGEDVIQSIQNTIGGVYNALPGTIRGDYGIFDYRTLVDASDNRAAARVEIERFLGDVCVVKQWECGWCGKTGAVFECFSDAPKMCTDCGHHICPVCGGLLSNSCWRSCGFYEDESDCAGTCVKCGWSCCGKTE